MSFRFSDTTPFLFKPGALFLGLDEKGREIGIKTEVHAITIGGSGAGKGSALLVPNARRWPHNLVCIDPKGENAVLSWEARVAKGQKVGVLDPFREIKDGAIPDEMRVSINPLDLIDPSSRRARAGLLAIGNGLVVVHDPRHMEWVDGARSLLAGIAAYVVADAPPELRNFATLRKLLMQPDAALYEDAKTMAADERIGGLIRSAGVTIMTAIDSDKGMEKDFLGLARRSTQWLDDDAISESLASSSFDVSELKTGNASLFLVLPADYLASYSGFLRLFVKSALFAMGGNAESRKECLFLLDEFYSLGKMDELSEAAGRMRSAGVHLWPFLQGIGQLIELYGHDGAQAFLTNADAHIFLGNDKDYASLEFISRRIGSVTMDEVGSVPNAPVTSGGTGAMIGALSGNNRGGQFIGSIFSGLEGISASAAQASYQNEMNEYQQKMSRVGRAAIEPHQVAKLIGKGEGEKVARSMIVFGPRGAVLNLRLAPYFRYDHSDPKPDEPSPAQTHYSRQRRDIMPVFARHVIEIGFLVFAMVFLTSPANPIVPMLLTGPVLTVFRAALFPNFRQPKYMFATVILYFGFAIISAVAMALVVRYDLPRFGSVTDQMWILFMTLYGFEDSIRRKVFPFGVHS